MTATISKVRAKSVGLPRSETTEKIVFGGGTVLCIVVIWEILSRLGVLPSTSIPPASETLLRLTELIFSAPFWAALGHTLQGTAVGLFFVCLVALPLGVMIGRVSWVERSTLLIIEFLKPIPPVALLPLALLFYGPTLTMKSVLVFLGALWPLLVQITYAARALDPAQLDMARSYRLSFAKKIRFIFLPSLTPYALTGLRISISIGLVIAVVAELIGGARGMGQEIAVAQNTAALTTMYSYIIATGLLGLVINGLFTLLSKPLLFWHASQRKEGNS